VADQNGHVACGNHHNIPVQDLMNAFLKDGVLDPENYGSIWPSREAIRALVRRIATPEFLRSDFSEWQHQIMSYWPLVSWLIRYAESMDRKAAATLKEFLDRKIFEMFPILGRMMAEMSEREDEIGFILAKERIRRFIGNWNGLYPTPEDYLARWQIFLEAAQYLGVSEEVLLYQHNIREAANCVQADCRYCPIYFEGVNSSGTLFRFLPDPAWRLDWCISQIALLYRPECGDIKLGATANSALVDKVYAEVRRRLSAEPKRVSPRSYWHFDLDGRDHIHMSPPTDSGLGTRRLSNASLVKVMQDLRIQLGGSTFASTLLTE
jgi:hypothetical protein